MFKPYFGGICELCGEAAGKKLIVINKPHLCDFHNKIRKGKDIIKKIQPKKRKATGELALFKEIYEERPDVCEWCGAGIWGFNVSNYHHVIHKSKRADLRLEKSNIVKICFKCHFEHHNK